MRETTRETTVRRIFGAFVLAVLTLLATTSPAAAETTIELAEEFPLRGQTTTVMVSSDDGAPVGGSSVTAIYRPNSETASTEVVGTLDASGRIAWTPTNAGIVKLEVHPAEDEGDPTAVLATMDLSVRYGGFPPAGLAIMLLAGLLLFGGAALGMVMLLREPLHAPADEPPSS